MLLEVPCTMKKMLMILDEQNEFFVNVHCIGQISQPPVADDFFLVWGKVGESYGGCEGYGALLSYVQCGEKIERNKAKGSWRGWLCDDQRGCPLIL